MDIKNEESCTKVPGSIVERLKSFIWYGIIMSLWLGIVTFWQEFVSSPKKINYDALPKRTGQTVVLTGGGRGIGLEVLRKLLQLDYVVIFGVRNVDAGLKAIKEIRFEGVKTGRAKCFPLDLKSLKSVRKFAQNSLKEADRIDLLINNAGVMFEPCGFTEDGYEVHFQVNYLSHFLLTQLLLPKLKTTAARKSTNCRIINVSSLGHRASSAENVKDVSNPKVYSAFRAYFDSKLCQILSTKYLDAQLKSEGANVNVYSLHPGVIVTDLYVNLYFVLNIVSFFKRFFRSTDDGADVVMYASTSPELENEGGVYISNSNVQNPSKVAESLTLQKYLWDLSQDCINSKQIKPTLSDGN